MPKIESVPAAPSEECPCSANLLRSCELVLLGPDSPVCFVLKPSHLPGDSEDVHTFRTWGHRADLGVEVQLSFPDPWEAVWAQTAAGSEQKAL